MQLFFCAVFEEKIQLKKNQNRHSHHTAAGSTGDFAALEIQIHHRDPEDARNSIFNSVWSSMVVLNFTLITEVACQCFDHFYCYFRYFHRVQLKGATQNFEFNFCTVFSGPCRKAFENTQVDKLHLGVFKFWLGFESSAKNFNFQKFNFEKKVC